MYYQKSLLPLVRTAKNAYNTSSFFSSPLAKRNYSEGYKLLVDSLPLKDRASLFIELKSPQVRARATLLVKELAQNSSIQFNEETSRTTLLAALLCVQRDEISLNQLASLHLLDSALHTLHINLHCFQGYYFVDHGTLRASTHYAPINTRNNNLAYKQAQRYLYDEICVPNEHISRSNLPERMRPPLICRYFNFTPDEWVSFHEEMQKAPESEQCIHVLIAPEIGHWSYIVARIQKYQKCMRSLDMIVEHEKGMHVENIAVVPSYSMFQAAINAKAKTIQRPPVQLAPTYGFLPIESYAKLKEKGTIALSLYLPELDKKLRYTDKGQFRSIIDGHHFESAYAGALHDIYHGFLEMMMSPDVSAARMRLANIAKGHPRDRMTPTSRSIYELLVDGELIFNYSPEEETIFETDYRPRNKETFGDLFHLPTVTANLHLDLKYAFIRDMVLNEELWSKQFKLGKMDLRKEEQRIYDEISEQQQLTAHVIP